MKTFTTAQINMKFVVLWDKVCVHAHVCVCVSVCVVLNAFPQLFSDIFKGSEQSRNCKFSNKHNDLKWFPFQTVKLVTESFGKFM